MSQRNGVIDVLKFFCAWLVVGSHFCYWGLSGGKFWGGLSVEFFFFVSGWLLTERADKVRNRSTALNIWKENGKYTLHRLWGFLPYMVVASVFSLVVTAMHNHDLPRRFFFSSLPDVIGLQMYGFSGAYTIGTGWYISALFFGSFLLYPLLLKWKEFCVCFIAPLAVLLIYGYCYHQYGTLSAPGSWTGFGNEGLWRGLASLSFGVLSHEATQWLNSLSLRESGIWFLHILEAFCYLVFFVTASIKSCQGIEFEVVCLIWIAVTLTFSHYRVFRRIPDTSLSRALGEASFMVYLNHFYVIEAYTKLGTAWRGGLVAIFLAIIVLSILCFILGSLIKKGVERLCGIFLQEGNNA